METRSRLPVGWIDRDLLDMGRASLSRGYAQMVVAGREDWSFGLWCNPTDRTILRLDGAYLETTICDTDAEFVAAVLRTQAEGIDTGSRFGLGAGLRERLVEMGLANMLDAPAIESGGPSQQSSDQAGKPIPHGHAQPSEAAAVALRSGVRIVAPGVDTAGGAEPGCVPHRAEAAVGSDYAAVAGL
ncbi:hypothetical protein [Nocardia sp. XZ_19_369]|uniref:hypothetical protein n=1 Tax=Nocardia sp. XZ_19_369 TaxID=2769487 RepID=UPI00188EBCF4|nr:hypothetical protein [Nocardia sp. XZ_19_369]